MPKITPVLMSGGAGTRLWPLSRRARPKQFHALGGEATLIQQTALRVTGEMFGPPMVVCNVAHADLVREQLAAVGVTPKALLSAAPIPDPTIERTRKRLKLAGEPPSPMDQRAAFRFLPSRLPVDGSTPVLPPELKEVAPGHLVAEFDPPAEAA